MDLTHKLAISYYKTIAVINEPHKIYLVQHIETNKIFIKKILDVYNAKIYEYLYNNYILGTPKIIDYFEEENQLIIIEEYISGISLQEKIAASDLAQEDILHYMMDLCNILEQLHSMKPAVIHRDIKPSNIIITNYNRAILLDFNAAKYYSLSKSEDTVLLGTQGYAAPEQYGFGASSPQTDIYSLGIILKEMCASINDISGTFDFIIDTCTRIKPSERFKSIKELKTALSAHIKPTPAKLERDTITSFIPPGFRTQTPWKMLLSSISYLFIFWLCLSLQVSNTYGMALWLERLFILIIMLCMIFACFNYRDVQRFMPLCKHSNKIIHYAGIIVLNIAIMFSLLIILCILEFILFPT